MATPRLALSGLTVGALLTATPALANAGTGLIVVGMVHVLVLNWGIGAIEAIIIALALPRGGPRGRVALCTVAGNLFAWPVALIAVLLVASLVEAPVLGHDPLGRLPWLLAALYLAALAITLLIEWPCVLAGLRSREQDLPSSPPAQSAPATSRRKLLGHFIAANVLTYGLLAWYYSGACDLSGLSRPVPLSEPAFVHEKDAVVLYEDETSGSLLARRLDGSPPRPAPVTRGQVEQVRASQRMQPGPGWWSDIRPEGTGRWRFGSSKYLDGLVAERTDGIERRWAVYAPYFVWFTTAGTTLPGDQVVYQSGSHIMVRDAETSRVAVVASRANLLAVVGRLSDIPPPQKAPVSPKANIPPAHADR